MNEPQLMNPYLPENQPSDFESWSVWDRDDWFQEVEDANSRALLNFYDPLPGSML